MSVRDVLRKAAGLLVELPPEPENTGAGAEKFTGGAGGSSVDRLLDDLEREAERRTPAKSVEQILKETHGPSFPEIQVPPGAISAPDPGAAPDFPKIYAAAGLPEASFGAESMLELLASLPAELPLEVRRQTVKASLNALGKSVGASAENLVADASRKLGALGAYVESLEHQTQERNTAAEQEITALRQRIAALQAEMTQRGEQLTAATRACEREADRLDDILEFFSMDVPPSRFAPPAK
jgi:hypothetical protein